MNFSLVILLICACVFETAWSAASNCDAKIVAYRQCTDKIRQERAQVIMMALDASRMQIEACVTGSGCKLPGNEAEHAKNISARQHCHEDIHVALKAQVRACVRKANPGFEFPPEDEPLPMEKEIKNSLKKSFLKACKGSADKVKAVEACIKKIHPEASASSKADLHKQRFEENCQKKKECETELGTCRPQLEALKKTVCQCNQDARTEANLEAARTSAKSCKGISETSKKGKGLHHKDGTQRPCTNIGQEKDWCKEGYEAWKNSHKKPEGGHKKPEDGHKKPEEGHKKGGHQ